MRHSALSEIQTNGEWTCIYTAHINTALSDLHTAHSHTDDTPDVCSVWLQYLAQGYFDWRSQGSNP